MISLRTPIFYYINSHTQNRCSKKSRKIHVKTLLLETLFNKTAGLRPAILLKRHFSTGVPVNFEKFPRTPFLQNTLGDCFLIRYKYCYINTFRDLNTY